MPPLLQLRGSWGGTWTPTKCSYPCPPPPNRPHYFTADIYTG
jgi:hypothetical protein